MNNVYTYCVYLHLRSPRVYYISINILFGGVHCSPILHTLYKINVHDINIVLGKPTPTVKI